MEPYDTEVMEASRDNLNTLTEEISDQEEDTDACFGGLATTNEGKVTFRLGKSKASQISAKDEEAVAATPKTTSSRRRKQPKYKIVWTVEEVSVNNGFSVLIDFACVGHQATWVCGEIWPELLEQNQQAPPRQVRDQMSHQVARTHRLLSLCQGHLDQR